MLFFDNINVFHRRDGDENDKPIDISTASEGNFGGKVITLGTEPIIKVAIAWNQIQSITEMGIIGAN